MVASADTVNRPVPARVSVMAAAEAPLEYASVGRTDNDRGSVQWSSAGQTEAIELGDCGRLQIGAQRGAIFGVAKPRREQTGEATVLLTTEQLEQLNCRCMTSPQTGDGTSGRQSIFFHQT